MGQGESLTIRGLRRLDRNKLSRRFRGLAKVRSKMAVRQFVARFDVDMSEAEHPLEHYESVLDLFTRRLAPGARPIDPDPRALVSPVDGAYLVGGHVESGTLLQAKGKAYSLSALLAGPEAAKPFEGGSYITLYLSPRDYHRIHSPADGKITGYTYVPGDLWPVNAHGVAHVDGLFAVNERITSHLETEAFGRVDVVKVGATNVGHMRLAYDDGIATNVGGQKIERRTYEDPIDVARGDELGVFEMGSTVIVVTERRVEFEPFERDDPVRLGRPLGALSG